MLLVNYGRRTQWIVFITSGTKFRSKGYWVTMFVSCDMPIIFCVDMLKGNNKNTELQEKLKINGKYLIKWQNQKLKHIKRMANNYHIPDLCQT